MLLLIKTVNCRLIQTVLRYASFLIKWREPVLLKGIGSIKMLPEAVKKQGVKKVLIVTDKVIENLGLMNSLLAGLDEAGIKYTVYKDVQPNPSVENIEEARKLYLDNYCGGFIAFGGGSPIDCAKVAAARISNPKKPVKKMRGMLRVTHKLPPLFAVPTTAGTGSETTITAVVKDIKTHEKYAVTDSKLRPRYAVLDPELTVGLPPNITGATGMDALTHAVEAYIGKSNTKHTSECARKAIKIIFENIETVYTNGSDLDARGQMLIASYYAGLAFTRAYVGYVHAIAHALGGIYNTPHGCANAVVLPFVLEYYGKKIHPQLAELADIAGAAKAGQNDAQKADAFINAVKELNGKLGIPAHIEAIKDEDIPMIVERVLREANPLYPVPRIMNPAECAEVVKKIKGQNI